MRGNNWTFHVECDVSSMNRRGVPYHTRLKSNFDRLLYIIFFITEIHRVRFVSVNEETTRVKPSSKKISKKSWKKNFGKKMLRKKNFFLNFGKKVGKKIVEKSFDKKNVGKINYKTKIFITKIYGNIDKYHTIFALLVPFDKTGRKTGSNEIVCSIWFKIGSVARSHWTQGMWRFKQSREKRYITACELSVTHLPHEQYLLHRWYGTLVSGLPPR